MCGCMSVCVSTVLLEGLSKSFVPEEGRGRMKDLCQRTRLAAACVDESGHLALVNAEDGEIVSKEVGEGEPESGT